MSDFLQRALIVGCLQNWDGCLGRGMGAATVCRGSRALRRASCKHQRHKIPRKTLNFFFPRQSERLPAEVLV